MATKLQPQCLTCILNRYMDKAPATVTKEETLAYMQGVLRILSEATESMSAPEIIGEIVAYKNSLFGFIDDFAYVKSYFNRLLLEKESLFEQYIRNSAEPIKAAMKFAMLGNYIDFGALNKVEESKLDHIPEQAEAMDIDPVEWGHFTQELAAAERVVYLTDNCGEIVMDKLLIAEMRAAYPRLHIDVIVRGGPVLNDATLEDARFVGLDMVADLSDNGTSVAGNLLHKISPQAKEKLDRADLIISKGQANFETLVDCGKNIYYAFLCKCDLYSKRFGVPHLTGMFINDRRI